MSTNVSSGRKRNLKLTEDDSKRKKSTTNQGAKLMTEEHKEILTTNFQKIAQNLTAGTLINKLVEEKIISIEEQQELNGEQVDLKRAQKLLHRIFKREDRAFDVFVEALKKTNQHHLANLLVPERADGDNDVLINAPASVTEERWKRKQRGEKSSKAINSSNEECGTVHMKIIIKMVNGAEFDNDIHNDVGLSIWKSLSYIVANVDPDETERLTPDQESTVRQFLNGFQKSGFTVKHVGQDPLLLSLECLTVGSLTKLANENRLGHLADQIENCLSPILATKMEISDILLETYISTHEYKLCRRKLSKEENTLRAKMGISGDNSNSLSEQVLQKARNGHPRLQTSFNDYGATLDTTTTGSVLFKLRFLSTGDLELFQTNLESGLLTCLVKDILITEDLKKSYNVNEFRISLTIADPWEYDQCHRELTDLEDAAKSSWNDTDSETTSSKTNISPEQEAVGVKTFKELESEGLTLETYVRICTARGYDIDIDEGAHLSARTTYSTLEEMKHMTLENLATCTDKYFKPLRVKVIVVSSVREYNSDDNTKQLMAIVGLADSTAATRAIVYGENLVQMMQINASLLIEKYNFHNGTISLREYASVHKTRQVTTTATTETSARELANPSSPKLSIQNIKKSPLKAMRTVEGTIIQDEAPKDVTVHGWPATVRDIEVEDPSGTVKVALWRELATSDLKTGDHIEISHVVVKSCNQEVSLRSTVHTSVRKTDRTYTP